MSVLLVCLTVFCLAWFLSGMAALRSERAARVRRRVLGLGGPSADIPGCPSSAPSPVSLQGRIPPLPLAALLAGAGFLVSRQFVSLPPVNLALGLLLGAVPFHLVRRRRQKYIERFEKSFPAALGLLARALRAGHTLEGGLAMAAEELDGPIRAELRRTVEEIRLGLGAREAVERLAERVGSADLRLFAVSVAVLRDTGGNLSEMIDNISSLIRERERLRGKIRAVTAESRGNASLLAWFPFFMAGVMIVINRDNFMLLLDSGPGRKALAITLLMQVAGVLTVRRLVRVET